MDALEFRVKQALQELMEKTYPEQTIPSFTVEVTVRDRVHANGVWYSPRKGQDAKILLCHMSRDVRYILKTAIHEAAHHCDYMLHKCTWHKAPFFEAYVKLIHMAAKMSILTPEMIADLLEHGGDGLMDGKMITMVKEQGLDMSPDPELEYKKGIRLIQVFDAYKYRERLKSYGYMFNSRSLGWELQVSEEKEEEEVRRLEPFELEPVVTTLLDIRLYATIYYTGNTYQCKELLKLRGFRYSKKKWFRKVPAAKLSEELGRGRPLVLKYGLKQTFTY